MQSSCNSAWCAACNGYVKACLLAGGAMDKLRWYGIQKRVGWRWVRPVTSDRCTNTQDGKDGNTVDRKCKSTGKAAMSG